MSIVKNFKSNQQIKLTPEQVLDLRDKYFNGLWSYTEILDLDTVNVSRKVVIDAIKGNRGYANIKDDIPQKTKDNRIPSREMYAQPTRAKEQRLRAQIKWPTPTYQHEPLKSFEELMK